MKKVKFDKSELSISKPRIIASEKDGRCWYPAILKFSTGEIMLNYSVNADANDNTANAQAVCISGDQGRTFDFCYDVNGFHNGCGEPRITLSDGRIIGTSTFLKPPAPGKSREFFAHRWIYDNGGRRYTIEPWGSKVSSLPGDVLQFPGASRTWWNRINWFSDIVAVNDGSWISTISMRFEGDELETTVAVKSDDEGRTWKYISTIASPSDVPWAKEGFDEPCLINLGNDKLMCISRVGSGMDQPLARAISYDAGLTWSKKEKMDAFSVAPQICRFSDDILLLVTGRPGLFIWANTSSGEGKWESFDLMAYHNETTDDWKMDAKQTSAYVDIVSIEPGKAMIVYDRSPFGWKPVPKDSGEESQIWLVEVNI